MLPLVLYPRMRLVSFSVVSFLFPSFFASTFFLFSSSQHSCDLSSPLSICVTSSSLPLLGFHWVLWWLRMRLFSILLCAGIGFYIPLCCFMVCFRSGALWASLLLHRHFGVWISPQVVSLVLHPLPWCPGCVVAPSPI